MIDSSAAWFVDGSYLFKLWQALRRSDKLDYLLLRKHLEEKFQVKIADAYYFNADPDPPTAKTNAFHSALAYPPPGGPGLRVKLYWLQKRALYWPQAWGGGPVLHPGNKRQYELIQQKAVDVGLAFHLMRSYGHRQWRTLFLAAGDGDFHEAIQHLVEHRDVAVILIGTLNSMSRELLPYAQAIEEVDVIADSIAR
ncbi:MAG: NYN domain-containing protein [Acidobacteriota bacterium]|nr:NYN domain-containing protein [Acidobacteriota bacterium]